MSEPENVSQKDPSSESQPPNPPPVGPESNTDTNISLEVSENVGSMVRSVFPNRETDEYKQIIQSIASIVEKSTKEQVEQRLACRPAPVSDADKKRYAILDKLRINCVNLAAYHNNRYHLYKNMLFTVFRVPLIVLSGLNSFFSVGLQSYMQQRYISLINAVISLFCGILTSVELLLNLQKRMEMEMECGKCRGT